MFRVGYQIVNSFAELCESLDVVREDGDEILMEHESKLRAVIYT